jgi:hypothetical protein
VPIHYFRPSSYSKFDIFTNNESEYHRVAHTPAIGLAGSHIQQPAAWQLCTSTQMSLLYGQLGGHMHKYFIITLFLTLLSLIQSHRAIIGLAFICQTFSSLAHEFSATAGFLCFFTNFGTIMAKEEISLYFSVHDQYPPQGPKWLSNVEAQDVFNEERDAARLL